MKKLLFFILLSFFSVQSLAAATVSPPYIVGSDGLSLVDLPSLVSTIEPGAIVILGELHENQDHHNNQYAVVKELVVQGHSVHIGMEFLNHTDQYDIYKYQSGLITKNEFLTAIGWTNFESFEFYSPTVELAF